jgi:hypothetical protein
MRTNEAFSNEVRRSRRMLFKKLYVIPWVFICIFQFGVIGYMFFQNGELEIRNTELVKKIRHKELYVSHGDIEIDVTQKLEDLLKEKLEKIEDSKVENSDLAHTEKRGFDFEYDQSQEEGTDAAENNENSKVEKVVVSVDNPELLELHMLKKQLDNEEIGIRSSNKIREDFGTIRTQGFSRENYAYAQELGVRVEVQIIKEIEIILEKIIDEYDNIFISENNRDLFQRELKYKLNEGILDQFRVYWELNK